MLATIERLHCSNERCAPRFEKIISAKKNLCYAFPAGEVRASMPTSRKNICCTTKCSTALRRPCRVRLRIFEFNHGPLAGSQHRKHPRECHYPLRPLPQLQIRGSASWERWKKRSPVIPMTHGSSPRASAIPMATLFLSGCRTPEFRQHRRKIRRPDSGSHGHAGA